MVTKSLAVLIAIAIATMYLFFDFTTKEGLKPMVVKPVVVTCSEIGVRVQPFVQYEQWLDEEPTIKHASLTQHCTPSGHSTLFWVAEGEPSIRYAEKEGEIELGIAGIKMVGQIPTRFQSGMDENLIIPGNEMMYSGAVRILASNDAVVVNGILYPVLRIQFHMIFENGAQATRTVWMQEGGMPVREIWDSGAGYTRTWELIPENYDRQSHIGIAER